MEPLRAAPWLIPFLLCGCAPSLSAKPPPDDAFYFPTGLAYVASADPAKEGTLYVASSNFDKRFDSGSLIAVDLSRVGDGTARGSLPPLASSDSASGDRTMTALNLGARSRVQIQSFAGEVAKFTLGDNTRLFVPSRSEGNVVHVINAQGDELSCFGRDDLNCGLDAISTTAFEKRTPEGEKVTAGLPRAPGPYGVDVSADGQVYLGHLQAADSPEGSGNYFSYVVSMDAREPRIEGDVNFIPLGGEPTHGVAVGQRYVYASGRKGPQDRSFTFLVRLIDQRPNASGDHEIYLPELESQFQVIDTRGIALSPDEHRLYVAGRFPDTLLVADIDDPLADNPTVHISKAVPLPEGANEVRVIPRPGRGNLVVITCATANVVVIYDDDVGDLVAQVPGVGLQPVGLAVQLQPGRARIFVSNFGDGQVAVIDVPDLDVPQRARLIARLGAKQTCLTQQDDAACQGATP